MALNSFRCILLRPSCRAYTMKALPTMCVLLAVGSISLVYPVHAMMIALQAGSSSSISLAFESTNPFCNRALLRSKARVPRLGGNIGSIGHWTTHTSRWYSRASATSWLNMESKGPEDGPKTGRGHLFQSLERWKKGITATVVAATLLGGSMLLPAPSKTVAHAAMAPSLMQDEKGYISIFEKSTPGVVYINTFVEQRDAFSMNVLEVPAGTGSGFVWDEKGNIVTNFHVIRQAQSAQVRLTLGDGTQSTFQAEVKGYDPDKDVAVLKIDAPASALRPIPVGESGTVKVGQLALAIGNPFGLDHTLTLGIVSGLGREVKSPSGRPISNVIQTDAAINPGNSGGPLLDSVGRIIGMNTAIYSPSGGSAGIGFAIPIDTLKTVVDTIIEKGRVSRPVIGITFLESARANTVGISKGVLVLDIAENTSAASSGLRPTTRTQLGDIIVAIDDHDINTEADLFKILEDRRPGDVITVTAQRVTSDGTETLVIKIELAERQSPAKELGQPSAGGP